MESRLKRPATLQAIAIALTGLSSIVRFPLVGASYSRFAITLLAGAVWLVVWALGAVERVDQRRRLYFIGIFVAVVSVVASAANSRFPSLAFTYGGDTGVSGPYWIALLVIMGMSSLVVLGRTTINALRWQYLWIVPVAVVCMIQMITSGHASFGFVNIDYFSPMMLTFAPVALGMAAKYPSQRGPWTLAAFILWASVLVGKTLSGLIGLAAQLVFLAMFAPGLLHLKRAARIALIVVLLSASLMFMVFGALHFSGALPAPLEEIASTSVFGVSSITRIEMWKVGYQEWRHRILLGVGPDEYKFEGQRYVSDLFHQLEHYSEPGIALPSDPHSLMVLLPVDFGLLGVAAAFILAAGWAIGVMSAPFKSTEGHLLRWSFALGALGFGYASMFTPFPLLFGGAPMMITGLALVRPQDPLQGQQRWVPHKLVGASLAMILAVALGGAAMIGRADFAGGGPLAPDKPGIFDVSRLQPQMHYYRFANLRERGRLLARANDPEAYKRYQKLVDESPESVRGFAPYLVELVRMSVDDALRTGRKDLSWETARLARAHRLSPTLPEIEVERAHVFIAEGDYAAAQDALESTAHWRGSVSEWQEYHELLSRMEQ